MTAKGINSETEVFLQLRPRLIAVAYRMLGSVADSEDILQEAYLRWQRVDHDTVLDPTGYLVRVTTRLCLDQLKSARVRREAYTGAWLPDPVLTENPIELLDQDVTVALLLALDRLSPLERAAFLLHDIFDGSYGEIAETLNRTPEACRQLAARARRKVRQKPQRRLERSAQGMALAEAFFKASKTGDTSALGQLLAADVELISDGGGKVIAALNPIYGADRVTRLLEGVARKAGGTLPAQWRLCQLNGLPGVVNRAEDGVLETAAFEIRDGRIWRIYVTRNPEKTPHLEGVLTGH
ncbi:sigma-70 family RNA polymerase sigma factor [Pseudophaeobacter sp.]|uniref:sigma-70 family RNA polymerase sigma factor n=1 Tax=Pseudophaeobacter sp. TaxID=1971739 RepID=UPI0032976167